MGPSSGATSPRNHIMVPILLAVLLGTCQLVLGGSYCNNNAVKAQLSGSPPNLRVNGSSHIQYSTLAALGWNLPVDRQPNGGSGRDFYSVFCNEQGINCTSQTAPFTSCTDAYSGDQCLVAGLGTPPPKSTQGIGEVRVAYTCAAGPSVRFWVLMYIFNTNGLRAYFARDDLWWIGFDDTIGKKLILNQDGSCTTEPGVPQGLRCSRVYLVYNGTVGLGKLFEVRLPASGSPGIRMKVHGQWRGPQSNGLFAETGTPEVCFPPCPAVSHDPHFVGAHGTHYDFNGLPEKSFCLLTDVDVHVNMQIVGYYDKRDFGKKVGERGALRSWIRELVIMWRADGEVHKFHLKSRSGPAVEHGSGYLSRMALDGRTSPALEIGESLDFPSLQFRFERSSNDATYKAGVQEMYSLKIGDKLEATIEIRPAHPLLRTTEDAYVHLSLTLIKVETTSDVHGVLGQTYRDDRDSRNVRFQKVFAKLHHLEADGETGKGFLDGATTDYVTSDVFNPDCKYNRFVEGETVATAASV